MNWLSRMLGQRQKRLRRDRVDAARDHRGGLVARGRARGARARRARARRRPRRRPSRCCPARSVVIDETQPGACHCELVSTRGGRARHERRRLEQLATSRRARSSCAPGRWWPRSAATECTSSRLAFVVAATRRRRARSGPPARPTAGRSAGWRRSANAEVAAVVERSGAGRTRRGARGRRGRTAIGHGPSRPRPPTPPPRRPSASRAGARPPQVDPLHPRVGQVGLIACCRHRSSPTSRRPGSSSRGSRPSAAARPFLVYRDGGGRAGDRRRSTSSTGSRSAAGRATRSRSTGTPRSRACTRRSSASGADWMVVDDGLSHNGTWVNGERVTGRRRLRDGDVIAVGATALAFVRPGRGGVAADRHGRPARTSAARSPRPSDACSSRSAGRSGTTPYATPATNQQIADELVVSVDAVKSTLRALFAVFGARRRCRRTASARCSPRRRCAAASSRGATSSRNPTWATTFSPTQVTHTRPSRREDVRSRSLTDM